MKIQTPTEFKTFRDGRCEVWSVSGNGLDTKICSVSFEDQTVTYRRYYAARAATTRVDRVIHVPQRPEIDVTRQIVIRGDRYKVEQCQPLDDTNPRITVLTLKKLGVVPDEQQY